MNLTFAARKKMSTNNKYDWAGPSLRIDIKRDPYTAVRTTPMKVLCLGMPRTGTMCKRLLFLFTKIMVIAGKRSANIAHSNENSSPQAGFPRYLPHDTLHLQSHRLPNLDVSPET